MRGERRAVIEREIEKALLLDKVSQASFFQFAEQHGIPKSSAVQIWNGASCSGLPDDTLEDLYALLGGIYKPVDDYLATLSGQQREQARMVLRRVGLSARTLFDQSLLQLSANELLAVLAHLNLDSAKTVSRYQSILRHFASWCVENGRAFPVVESLKDPRFLKTDSVPVKRAIKTNYLSGTEELETILSAVFEDNGNNTGCILCILLYLGISMEDARRLKDEEVVESGDSLIVSGTKYVLTPYLLSLVRRYRMIRQCSGNRLVYYASTGPYFLKRFARQPDTFGEPLAYNSMRDQLFKVAALYREATGEEKKLSETTLRCSGWFSKMRQMEIAGRSCNVELMQEISGMSKSVSYDLLKRYKEYKHIYG